MIMKKHSSAQMKKAVSETDWDRVSRDAAKGRRSALDADDTATTAAEIAKAVRGRGQRGPQKAPTKRAVSLRLSADVLAEFKGTGKGWQTRIDAALREHLVGNAGGSVFATRSVAAKAGARVSTKRLPKGAPRRVKRAT